MQQFEKQNNEKKSQSCIRPYINTKVRNKVPIPVVFTKEMQQLLTSQEVTNLNVP